MLDLGFNPYKWLEGTIIPDSSSLILPYLIAIFKGQYLSRQFCSQENHVTPTKRNLLYYRDYLLKKPPHRTLCPHSIILPHQTTTLPNERISLILFVQNEAVFFCTFLFNHKKTFLQCFSSQDLNHFILELFQFTLM